MENQKNDKLDEIIAGIVILFMTALAFFLVKGCDDPVSSLSSKVSEQVADLGDKVQGGQQGGLVYTNPQADRNTLNADPQANDSKVSDTVIAEHLKAESSPSLKTSVDLKAQEAARLQAEQIAAEKAATEQARLAEIARQEAEMLAAEKAEAEKARLAEAARLQGEARAAAQAEKEAEAARARAEKARQEEEARLKAEQLAAAKAAAEREALALKQAQQNPLTAFGQKIGQFFRLNLPNGTQIDIPENGAEAKLLQEVQKNSGTRHVFDRIYFETNSAALNKDSRDQIESVATILLAYPDYRIGLRGHTDWVGSAVSNQELSEQRAASVKNALVAAGVNANRIGTQGMGESEPIDTNSTPEGRRNNRRIDFVLIR